MSKQQQRMIERLGDELPVRNAESVECNGHPAPAVISSESTVVLDDFDVRPVANVCAE